MKSLLACILSLLYLPIQAQTNIRDYYRDSTNKIYTFVQFDSLRRACVPCAVVKKSITTHKDSTITLFKILKSLPAEVSNFTATHINKKLPPFALTDVNGKKVTMADLAGKVVHINFWYTGCAPCRVEIPGLNKLVEKYKNNKDVVFLAISYEDQKALSNYLKKEQFNYRLLANGGEYSKALKVTFYPANFFIDRNGFIKAVPTGTPSIKNFEISVFESYSKIIDDLLKGD